MNVQSLFKKLESFSKDLDLLFGECVKTGMEIIHTDPPCKKDMLDWEELTRFIQRNFKDIPYKFTLKFLEEAEKRNIKNYEKPF